MLRKIVLTLSVAAMLSTAVMAPNAALAFGPPPGLGGPPPGLGGPPPGLAAPHLGLGGHAPGLAARPPQLGAGGPRIGSAGATGHASGYNQGHAGRYGYGYRGRHGVFVYGDGGYSSESCYYTYDSRGRRVRVCD